MARSGSDRRMRARDADVAPRRFYTLTYWHTHSGLLSTTQKSVTLDKFLSVRCVEYLRRGVTPRLAKRSVDGGHQPQRYMCPDAQHQKPVSHRAREPMGQVKIRLWIAASGRSIFHCRTYDPASTAKDLLRTISVQYGIERSWRVWIRFRQMIKLLVDGH